MNNSRTRYALPMLAAFVYCTVCTLTMYSVHSQDSAKVTIEASSNQKEQPRVYSATIDSAVSVAEKQITQRATISFDIHQGTDGPLSLELFGAAQVNKVEGKGIRSWSIRKANDTRYLDFTIPSDSKNLKATVTLTQEYKIPGQAPLAHFRKGPCSAFQQTTRIEYTKGIAGEVIESEGFLELTGKDTTRFQSTAGGILKLKVYRDASVPPPVQLSAVKLEGIADFDSQTITFRLTGTAVAHSNEAFSMPLLSGKAAILSPAETDKFSVVLKDQDYHLHFPANAGNPFGNQAISIDIEFSARLEQSSDMSRAINFSIHTEGVVPVTLSNLDENIQFTRGNLNFSDGKWTGFLPANGKLALAWKPVSKNTDGKVFFSSRGIVETRIGTGMARQTHEITYRILQGKIRQLKCNVIGSGEVVSVSGPNILSWENRDGTLIVDLNEEIEREAVLSIQTQTVLDALPTEITPVRIEPTGTIRHSGFIRLANQGSVRIDPSDLVGVTQLSPEKFPGKPIESRQVFVFRFPSNTYSFTVSCDRIQPVVHLSEITRHHFSEGEQTLESTIELDIRDATIREWNILVPADYAVVSVTGNEVSDYILASDVEDQSRNVKILFASDVIGRKLIRLFLENNAATQPGDWTPPELVYPEAESVRGDLGFAASPGYRMTVNNVEGLTERPLSSFPGESDSLQHYYRLRDAGWSATVDIQQLDESIQADVFHLYSLSEGIAYGSVLLNYFITGAPTNEFQLQIPDGLENVIAEGKDLRSQKLEDGTLTVSLHQAVMGAFTLLITFEEKASESIAPGGVTTIGIQAESGFIQLVSPGQITLENTTASDSLLQLDHLELPPEFRLLSASPSLGIWQYNQRPFEIATDINWLYPDRTLDQVVEFAEATTLLSRESETVTDLIYYVKSRDNRPFSLKLPDGARIWDVRTNGRSVASRISGEFTQIPLLLSRTGSNLSEIRMRLGNKVEKGRLHLPTVAVPVLKTGWHVRSESNEVTRLRDDAHIATTPVLPPSGFAWVEEKGLLPLLATVALIILGLIIQGRNRWLRWLALVAFLGAAVIGIATAKFAYQQKSSAQPLHIHIPVLSAGEEVSVEVQSIDAEAIAVSGKGTVLAILGIAAVVCGFIFRRFQLILLTAGLFLVCIGLLCFANGGYLFFGLISLITLTVCFIPTLVRICRLPRKAAAAAAIVLVGLFPATGDSAGWETLQENWNIDIETGQVKVLAKGMIHGESGEVFPLLRGPATLTDFQGGRLLLRKQKNKDGSIDYLAAIPAAEDPFNPDGDFFEPITIAYQLNFSDPKQPIAVPTGKAAFHKLTASIDQPDWEFSIATSARTTRKENTTIFHLIPADEHSITLQPKKRDPASETTEFYSESQQLYLPSPGVIDGIHQFDIRPARGLVRSLHLGILKGFTVSDVQGPVSAWQFDPENQSLSVEVDPPQAGNFTLRVDTQSGLEAFPADAQLAPLFVEDAIGQTGMIGLAFGEDAKPETITPEDLTPVNLDDFNAGLAEQKSAVLHRVYRFKENAGSLVARIAEVAPEVRVTTEQVLSLGDENLLLSVNFSVEISRAGIFQLHFTIPESLEVNSLSGEGLQNWTESVADGIRTVTLHFNGKTIGRREFSVSLNSTPPSREETWALPRFTITEANRQTGELIIQPATGIRLSLADRQNVSELDPRDAGAREKGALAFRLLQKDWNVGLDIETLAPRVTGDLLHDTTIRDARVRTAILGRFLVENAAIRSLRVALPELDEETVKTLRASGSAVRELVKVEGEDNLWDLELKRWLTGDLPFQIEWEHRTTPENGLFQQTPVEFPDARQVHYFFAARPTGRIETELSPETESWRQVNWNSVPKSLREASNRIAPSLALKARTSPGTIGLVLQRHSLADALKLRMSQGSFRTVLSPYGTRLTSATLEIEVIQRSHMAMTLPPDSDLFCLFVNGETVPPVKKDSTTWQFPVLPDANGRQARIFALYLEPGNTKGSVTMTAPLLNIPMENITWDILSPSGIRMTSQQGNLNYIEHASLGTQDRSGYLEIAQSRRKQQAEEAVNLLEKANDLLQSGQQTLARQALKSVANRSGLDAASNEDARVQLETLQTRQALVGLNTRRQRMYLDRSPEETHGPGSDQLRESASRNPVIQMGDLNFRPGDLSQLLQGNSSDELMAFRKIASRIVSQQQVEEVSAPGLDIAPPYEGNRYRFERSVQVTENAPLELELDFSPASRVMDWRWFAVLALVLALGFAVAAPRAKQENTIDR